MTSSRIPLAAAGIVAGALVVQTLLGVISTVVSVAGLSSPIDRQALFGGVAHQVLLEVGQDILFGIAVFVAFKFVTRISASDTWRRVLRTGALAAVFTVVVVLVIGVVVSLVNATNPGQYPFGYAFTPTFDSNSAGLAILGVFVNTLERSVAVFALTIVVAGAQKLWLSRAETVAPDPVTVPASRVG